MHAENLQTTTFIDHRRNGESLTLSGPDFSVSSSGPRGRGGGGLRGPDAKN